LVVFVGVLGVSVGVMAGFGKLIEMSGHDNESEWVRQHAVDVEKVRSNKAVLEQKAHEREENEKRVAVEKDLKVRQCVAQVKKRYDPLSAQGVGLDVRGSHVQELGVLVGVEGRAWASKMERVDGRSRVLVDVGFVRFRCTWARGELTNAEMWKE